MPKLCTVQPEEEWALGLSRYAREKEEEQLTRQNLCTRQVCGDGRKLDSRGTLRKCLLAVGAADNRAGSQGRTAAYDAATHAVNTNDAVGVAVDLRGCQGLGALHAQATYSSRSPSSMVSASGSVRQARTCRKGIGTSKIAQQASGSEELGH
jgi:hypothetical protein